MLLRYFENKTLRDVGKTLGVGEDAAQKRVSRAVEKLREFFTKRNINIGASGLVVLISANAVQAAPIGLIAIISTAVTATTITIATHTTMHWINFKSVAAILAAAVATGTGTHFLQQRETNRLRNENQMLIAQQTQLSAGRDAAVALSSHNTDELERQEKNYSELLRLRGEVGLLRKQSSGLAILKEENRRLRAASL
ncbi:MAG: sigma factor-like helix-turn-helix DNA-binding protein, partial [Limisphaerales bacterium]